MTGSLVLPAPPTSDLQAGTKKYVDEKFANLPTSDLTPHLKKDGTVTMTGHLNLGLNKMQGLVTGVLSTDSTIKGHVDGVDAVLQG